MSFTVRPATSTDVPWLLKQLLAFDDFFGTTRSLFPSREHAESILTSLIAQHPFVLAVKNDTPVGFIAGALLPHPYNPDVLVLNEMFWWVAEAYRGSRAGLLLLNEFIAIGTRSAHWIVMTLEAESRVDPAHLFKKGFRMKESSYLLEVG